MYDYKIRKAREQKRLITKFLELLAKTEDKFDFELGNNIESIIIRVTYIKDTQHNFITIYSFDPLERQKAKEKLICDALLGKVSSDDFNDLRFLN